jgi:hypothetical protein
LRAAGTNDDSGRRSTLSAGHLVFMGGCGPFAPRRQEKNLRVKPNAVVRRPSRGF